MTVGDAPPGSAYRRLWLLATALVCLVIVVTWLPALELPLGDDHRGRILGRMALHADNFVDRGWVGSSYISTWVPYSDAPYAHHPPLSQFLHAGLAWLQGGASAVGLRLVDMLAGVLTIAALVWTVRKLSRSWLPAAFAAAGLALSGYFWFFGRTLNLVLIAIFFLTHAHARKRTNSRFEYVLLGLAAMATLQSWEGAFIIGLLAIYDFFRGARRRGVLVAIGILVGFAADLWWIESAAGIDALRGHLEERVAAANYGIIEWVLRQGGFYLRFESLPIFVATLIALIAGLRDRELRPYVATSFVALVVFATLFYENAWVHEYWNFRISLVLALGMGALGRAVERLDMASWALLVVVVLVSLTAAIPISRLESDLYAVQFVESSEAGALVERNQFPPDQRYAWHFGDVSGPRWYAWYTELPVRQFDPEQVDRDDALVLVKRRHGDGLGDIESVDSSGLYALVRAGELASALAPGP